MASFRRTESNKIQAIIRMKGNTPVSKVFTKMRDARRWAKKVESDIESGRYTEDSVTYGDRSLAGLLDAYCKARVWDDDPNRRVKPQGNRKKRDTAHHRIQTLKRELGHYTLRQLTVPKLVDYRDKRLETKSAATVCYDLAVLRSAMRWAAEERAWVLPHGIPSIKRPKVENERDRWLKPGEQELLRQHLHPSIYVMVEFSLETAVRRAELCRMRREHIQSDGRHLRIPKTKTGKPRTIYLSARAREILEEQHRQVEHVEHDARRAITVVDRRKFTGAVWLHTNPETVSKAFRRACEAAGIRNLHFHDLRHEGTSRLFKKGLTAERVMEITGHRSYASLKRYTHLQRDKQFAECLG